jgi:hypothetical protein
MGRFVVRYVRCHEHAIDIIDSVLPFGFAGFQFRVAFALKLYLALYERLSVHLPKEITRVAEFLPLGYTLVSGEEIP